MTYRYTSSTPSTRKRKGGSIVVGCGRVGVVIVCFGRELGLALIPLQALRHGTWQRLPPTSAPHIQQEHSTACTVIEHTSSSHSYLFHCFLCSTRHLSFTQGPCTPLKGVPANINVVHELVLYYTETLTTTNVRKPTHVVQICKYPALPDCIGGIRW